MTITVKEAAAQCTPGSTNFASCVRSKTGLVVADWSNAAVHQNQVIAAAKAISMWTYFMYKGYNKYIAPEYFDYIPVGILKEAVNHPVLGVGIMQECAVRNVDLPDFIEELIEK